ncbi:MAG: hypothetical protein HQL45_05770 [Alphaproteobacteria bacterium]|nr:hypothetical protein [Alphaproteobacteria bacterium]
MKPLETHLELSCHQALLSRVKEVLDREGFLPPHAGIEEVKSALSAWVDFVETARHGRPCTDESVMEPYKPLH